MYRHIILLLLFCVFVRVQPYISLQSQRLPCGKYDNNCITKLSNNIFKKAVDGDSSANIKSLEPLKVKHIEGKFGIMNYDLYNNSLVGLKNCDIVDTQLILEQNSMQIKLICPYLYIRGIYEVSGYIIIVPIEGKGDYSLHPKDYHIYIDTETKIIQAEDGTKYLNFKSFKVTGDIRGGNVIDLTNLFNGQHKELADAALKFANEQWKPVSNQFQGPILYANIKKIIKNMNKYLKTMPLDNLLSY